MAAEIICDGCGKREPMAIFGDDGWSQWTKPEDWYRCASKDAIYDACSLGCIKKISEKTGVTKEVLPED